MRAACIFALFVAGLGPTARAFSPRRSVRGPAATRLLSQRNDFDAAEDVGALSARELKRELRALGVSTDSFFEKSELVEALLRARESGAAAPKAPPAGRRLPPPDATVAMNRFRLGNGAVEATNGPMTLRPDAAGDFFSVDCSCDVGTGQRTMKLLVDTACSGVVIRPASASRLGLSMISTQSASMTAAGGTSAVQQIARIDAFALRQKGSGERVPLLRSLGAAVQEVGALPGEVDGIIGLAAFQQYGAFAMDFAAGDLELFREPPELLEASRAVKVPVRISSIGVPSAEVEVNGEGPIKMVVDTGAASSFVNWAAMAALGCPKGSPDGGVHGLRRLAGSAGAMGADGAAIPLTHTIDARSVRFASAIGEDSLGSRVAGDVSLEVGELPVLQALAADGVTGVLGMNVLQALCTGLLLDTRAQVMTLWGG